MAGSNLPVIITRAEPGTHETAARLIAIEQTPIPAPVLCIQPNASVEIPANTGLSGLVFTSANGVRCYIARSNNLNIPAWCVGPATAKAARDAGFETVHESAGNAVDLAHHIARHSKPADKPLLHVANDAAKGDLKRQLEQFGFKVQFCPLYRMRQADGLPDAAIEALVGDKPALVLIHSAKGAEAFVSLVKDLALKQLVGVAISEQAAQPLAAIRLSAVQIANAPNEDGLFDAINTAIATLSA